MKAVFVIFVIFSLVGFSLQASVRQISGVCAELCPEDGCPEGTVCRPTGCGHECMLASITLSPASCQHQPLCDMFCANGFVKGNDGCYICRCAL